MKYLIMDSNNIASLSFFRAKSELMKEVQKKLTVDNEEELLKEARDNITGFGLHMFFNKIHSIIKLNKDYRVVFIWDGRLGSKWRKEVNPDYKGNRKHGKDDFYPVFLNMMNECRDILKGYPIIQFSKEEAEADDLIYSICKLLPDAEDVKVISTDTDMIQLIQKFSNTHVWSPIKKTYHVAPEYDYVLCKAVTGDKSDNIFGVPRYGAKKGAKVAIEGLDTLPAEYHDLVNKNINIIDMALNPHEAVNTALVKSFLASETEQLPYDVEYVKNKFFEWKLKNQIEKFAATTKLIKALP